MALPIEPKTDPVKEDRRVEGQGRRRFIQGIGLAAPLVMTVHSPSALAGTCLAPSATASIALLHSRQDRDRLLCSGMNPTAWIAEYKRLTNWDDNNPPSNSPSWPWPSANRNFYPDFNMNTLLFNAARGNSVNAFRLDMTAAYLNRFVNSVPVEVLDSADLTAMWNGRNGTYTPTPGVTWGRPQISNYLTQTWS